jgi:transcriptional regulator with XRE-family HTH domain
MTSTRVRTNGAAVRALREAHGWKANAFAAAVGISPAYLCNVEAQRRQVSAPVLRKMADVLGVPLAAINGGYDPVADLADA